jgi:hypothetical protein
LTLVDGEEGECMASTALRALKGCIPRVTRGSQEMQHVQLEDAVRLLLRHGTRHQRWKDDQAARYGKLTARRFMEIAGKDKDCGRVRYRKDW